MTKPDFETYQKTFPRFRDPAKIFRDPLFSRYHSPPLFIACVNEFFLHSSTSFSLMVSTLTEAIQKKINK